MDIKRVHPLIFAVFLLWFALGAITLDAEDARHDAEKINAFQALRVSEIA